MQRKKAIVAMSGGVDSSVAALLMQEAGYEVIGISMKLWDYDEAEHKPNTKTCCAAEDIGDARAVADRLGIPFYAVNYTDTFKEKVITPFVTSYLSGETPNPCILCNQHIKFDYFLERAKALGASVLATGHYARIETAADGRYRLLKGADPEKDQSYFLFHLGQSELAALHFPIGAWSKKDVRERAAAFGLCTAQKRESQEICFVPDNDHAAFIRRWQGKTEMQNPLSGPGPFRSEKGEQLGTHEGIYAYTIGQRRGIKVGGLGSRHYVTDIDPRNNTVTLGERAQSLFSGLEVRDLHWIRDSIEGPCEVKIRHRHLPVEAEIALAADKRARVSFKAPQHAVAPGQAAVFYRGDEVLGGGWIDKGMKN